MTAASAAKRAGREERLERYERFVDHVRRVCQRDPGRRAALRRSLGRPPETVDFRAHEVVAPFLPERKRRAEERAFYAIAALIAAQPRSARDQERSDAEPPEETTAGEAGSDQPAEDADSPPAMSEPPQRVNLGTTLAGAVSRVISERTAEARLHLLARQGVEGCHRQLPALIRLLRSHEERVDWVQLLDDLVRLDRYRDEVTKQWLQSFHRTLFRRSAAPKTPDSSSTTEQTGDVAP